MDAADNLKSISERSREAFRSKARIQSFAEYLGDMAADPFLYVRCAPEYLADMFDFYGSSTVETSGGTRTRWNLFDAPFAHSSQPPLVGQEYLQMRLHQAIRSFAREGRADKIILIHGPNGSGKTTVADLIFEALEDYSARPEGVLYRYSWVFPSKKATGGQLGFKSGPDEIGFSHGKTDLDESFAHLEEEDVDLRMACELKDHPVFLLPQEERRALLEECFALAGEEKGARRRPSPFFLEGELCHKCRQVYDALLTEYRGDLAKVLRHIRVERIFISRRYRRAATSIYPQLQVDAGEAQISSDQSLAALPASLQTLTLFNPMGGLVDANAGLVEFSDLLKRPMELNHYLLNTVETAELNLPHSTIHLNLVMVATSNETHLDAFKKIALWSSFKARTELISAPYLLEFRREAKIYAEAEQLIGQRKHVAPHAVEMAALWAVLTRLNRPDPDKFPSELRPVVREIKPLDKALLYDRGETGPSLSSEDRIRLRAALEWMKKESHRSGIYEGRYGASPREMKQVLLYALYDGKRRCVTPMDIFDQIGELVRDKSVHEFLQIQPDGPYHNPEAFLTEVVTHYLGLLSEEIRDAMDLVAPEQYGDLFQRYLRHTKALLSHETIRNPQTGKEEQPDTGLLEEVESIIAGEEKGEEFRGGIISRIGAYRVEHPDEEIDTIALFPELIARLREDFYKKHQETIGKIEENLLRYGTEEFEGLDLDLQRQVERTVRKMESDYGYCQHCAKDTIAFLLRSMDAS